MRRAPPKIVVSLRDEGCRCSEGPISFPASRGVPLSQLNALRICSPRLIKMDIRMNPSNCDNKRLYLCRRALTAWDSCCVPPERAARART